MGARALEFCRAHTEGSQGYAAALARLEERLGRAERLAAQQRDGVLQVRAATALKRELRVTLRRTHLQHLAGVAALAAREQPELGLKFVITRDVTSYQAFRTAAHGMAAAATANKELLVRHGLADLVLSSLSETLAQLDQAMDHAVEGRRAHIGASADLATVADEVVLVVKVMDGLNRLRFAQDPERLAAWESASSVVAAPRAAGARVVPEEVPTGGDLRPAA
jgi:hypothetical protein